MSDEQNEWVEGFGSVPARKGGTYLNPGIYTVVVCAVVKQTSRAPKTKGNTLVIFEGSVERVIQAYEAATHKGQPGWGASTRPDEKFSSINNFSVGGETAMANVKGYLLACLQARAIAAGKPPPQEKDLDANGWNKVLIAATKDAGTYFAGLRLRVYASQTVTRADKPFTALRWEPELVAPTPAAA